MTKHSNCYMDLYHTTKEIIGEYYNKTGLSAKDLVTIIGPLCSIIIYDHTKDIERKNPKEVTHKELYNASMTFLIDLLTHLKEKEMEKLK